MLKSFWWLIRCRPDRLLQRRLAGLNPTGKTLAKHADRAEFQCARDFIAAARAGALGLRAHGPKRPSSGLLAEGNTLHGEVRNRPARPLANYCPVPQAIACSCILARQITFRNKIPTARVLRRPVSILNPLSKHTSLWILKVGCRLARPSKEALIV